MAFKERAKDLGRTLIGQGREVKFKRDAEAYSTAHGVPMEQAQKAIFLSRTTDLKNEAFTNGALDLNSETGRRFQAAMRETMKEQIKKMAEDAKDPSVFRAVLPLPVSPARLAATRGYFSGRFGGKAPDFAVINDVAKNNGQAIHLLNRFSGDPALATAPNLETAVTSRPDLGADLGMVLLLGKENARHERMFRKNLAFERIAADSRTEMKEALGTLLWKTPVEWLHKMGKGGFRFDMSRFGEALGATIGAMGQAAWAATRLGFHAAKIGAAYVYKQTK